MKIVIINQHPHDFLGGSEIQCDTVATYLTSFGHKVLYLAVKGLRDTYSTPYPVIAMMNLNPFRLYTILRAMQPDVVYWRYDTHKMLLPAIVSKVCRTRLIFAMSSLNDSKIWMRRGKSLSYMLSAKGPKVPFPVAIYKTCQSFVVSVKHFVSLLSLPFLADGVVSLNSAYLASVRVKTKITIHDSMSSESVEFHWPRPYVIWVANLKSIKNPEKYYELAEALQDTGVDFLMVGKLHDNAYQYIANPGVATLANFYFLGPKSPAEVNGMLKKALFLVHTCDPEGFGDNFIQAWLQGKPTISLYFDPEGIIESQGIGYFSRTFERFVDQTRILIENVVMQNEMGDRALSYANKHFNPDINVRELEAFIAEINDGKIDPESVLKSE